MFNIRVLMPFVQGRYSNRNKGVTVPEDAHREEIIDALAGVMGDPHFAKAAKEHFYVSCNGRVIKGDTTLRDVGGREGSSVTCTLSLRGGGGPCVGKRGQTATDLERQDPDSKRACRLTSDIPAKLGEDADHAGDADHADADADADGCDADHADADHADEPLGNAISAALIHSHTPPQCSAEPQAKVPSDDSEPEESRPEKVSRLTAHARTQARTNGL